MALMMIPNSVLWRNQAGIYVNVAVVDSKQKKRNICRKTEARGLSVTLTAVGFPCFHFLAFLKCLTRVTVLLFFFNPFFSLTYVPDEKI